MASGALLGLIILGGILFLLGPLAALGVMFWQWQKELKKAARLREARTTQFR